MAWFRRKNADNMDAQYLLAQAHEATPLEPIASAEPGTVAAGVGSGFRMTIQDVFSITGRGTVVTGRIEAGTISTGNTVRLTRPGGSVREVAITGIEAFRKKLEVATAGENVGLLLRDVSKTDVAAGDILSA